MSPSSRPRSPTRPTSARIQRFITETVRRFGAPPVEVLLRRHGIEKENDMTDYDNRNRGALFRNDDKDPNDDRDRDYNGTLDIEGTEYWISGWVRTSKKSGRKYLSLSVKPKVEKPAESERKSPAEDFNDRIPF
jgi:hypothetical protein